MKHFENIKLERYVPNNWLRKHGIPAKRRRHLGNISITPFFEVDEMYMISESLEAKTEMKIISGRITREDVAALQERKKK